ncbi:cytochrome P450 [Lentinus tigrinus ALCF2SS1-7]|uniref:Cytochrome P450 n=1 Tax=Lentinus tigrinus ALCF2SS1-6 TaxID=1328759 RepID=A0A5C2SKX1_9APHY|nr:cytochrome P450 [Lentinus tigrinus ALCF2SS1-6]RPD76707.1 cytochrome P450 [Lentinus tigrinus ALCF2SS1-7]
MITATDSALLLLTVALLLALYTRKSAKGRLPPGPRPLPVVGNVLDFPRKHLGREFRGLSLQYGDVVYLRVLGQSVVILGSYEAACELMEKRSANYSDRPHSVMVNLTNLDWIFVFKNYGLEWRRYRRAFHNQFLPTMVVRYQAIQQEVTHNLLRNLLEAPERFSYHIKFSFAASILRITYGVNLTQGDTTHHKLAQELAHIAEDISTPGQHVVEAFPFMLHIPSWTPGGGFKKLAERWKKEIAAIRDQLYDSAKETMDKQGVHESIMTRLTAAGEDEEMAKNVTATIYAAGADTTNASVHAFILAMAKYPKVQERAQAELDAVVGPDRLPGLDDRAALPYTHALVKEVLRWHVVAPIGVPHRSVEDDEYKGYLIPAGSIVLVNQWALSRDETMYAEPEVFEPERFLRDDGRLNPEVRDPTTYVFGFGRRICPGKHFAEASLFMVCASILHTFIISPPVDEAGVPRKLDVNMGSNLAVSHPDRFDCRIVPRDARRRELIRGTAAS